VGGFGDVPDLVRDAGDPRDRPARCSCDGGIEAATDGRFIAAAAMLTVLSGLWMYWVFTHGFDSTIVAHGAGLALGIGGLCGIAAAVIGGAVIGRAAERAGKLSQQVAQLPDGEEREATMQSVTALQRRIATFSRLAVVLLVAALVAMTVAHVL